MDTLDKLVLFLAKRDGIDKVVKTLQYIGKLGHYNFERQNSVLASRYKNLEVAAGMSRKAFRTGRSLAGFNTLRTAKFPDLTIQLLTIIGTGGEMVYWFFDHFTWLSKMGVLDADVAQRTMYISAFGESVWYIFFITMDVILIKRGMKTEMALKQELEKVAVDSKEMKVLKARIAAIKVQRVMSVMSIVAKTSDLFIALAVVDPNPFVSHTVTLGLSGLASAWAGWYLAWPESKPKIAN